jgi:hypothetical protein
MINDWNNQNIAQILTSVPPGHITVAVARTQTMTRYQHDGIPAIVSPIHNRDGKISWLVWSRYPNPNSDLPGEMAEKMIINFDLVPGDVYNILVGVFSLKDNFGAIPLIGEITNSGSALITKLSHCAPVMFKRHENTWSVICTPEVIPGFMTLEKFIR